MAGYTHHARKHAGALGRQALVGLLCLCLNLLLMWWLVARAGLSVLAASTICFFALNALAHGLARRLVFAGGHRPYHQSLLRYLLVMAGSLALNLGAMAVATQWLGLHYLLASIAIAAMFFVGNYSAHYLWTFR